MSPSRTDSYGNNWVRCDQCLDWILYENSKLKTPFRDLEKKKDIFTCRACLLEQRLEKLELQVMGIDATAKATKQSVESSARQWADIVKESNEVKVEMRKVAATIEASSGPSADLTAPQLRQAADEAADTKRRELNLIISGLKENGDDMADLMEYAWTCQVSLTMDDIEEAERLGRPGPNPRLLRIRTNSTRMRRNLLTMRPNERPGNSQCIYTRPDLTKAQIEIDKKLRAELAIMGKDNFMIKKGRIVPRPTMETHQESSSSFLGASGPSTTRDKGKQVISQMYFSKPKTASEKTELGWNNKNDRDPAATAPQAAAPRSTPPQSSTPQLAALQSTTPQSTAPQPTASQSTAPQPIAPQATATQPAASQSTAPQTTAPQCASSQPAAPQSTLPLSTAPQSTPPRPTAPQSVAPQSTAPQSAAPQPTAPQLTAPQATPPQSTPLQPAAPQFTLSQSTAPHPTPPRSTVPQSTTPQSNTLQTAAPQPTPPQSTTPQFTAPQPAASQPSTPQATSPQSTAPQSTVPQSVAPQSIAAVAAAGPATSRSATSLPASPVRSSQRIASKTTKMNAQKLTPQTAASNRTQTNSAPRGGGGEGGLAGQGSGEWSVRVHRKVVRSPMTSDLER